MEAKGLGLRPVDRPVRKPSGTDQSNPGALLPTTLLLSDLYSNPYLTHPSWLGTHLPQVLGERLVRND